MRRAAGGLFVGVFAAVGMALWGVWFVLTCAFVGLILISASQLEKEK